MSAGLFRVIEFAIALILSGLIVASVIAWRLLARPVGAPPSSALLRWLQRGAYGAVALGVVALLIALLVALTRQPMLGAVVGFATGIGMLREVTRL